MKQVGVIGYPIKHSISPVFQQAAFDALGIEAIYKAYEVPPEDLRSFFFNLRNGNWLGVNVTIPHKSAAAKLADERSQEVSFTGAANTIISMNGRLKAHNTDISGFILALEENGFQIKSKRAVVLGSGGTTRAVVYALAICEAQSIAVIGRSQDKVHSLISELKPFFEHKQVTVTGHSWEKDSIRRQIQNSDILINTTPIGMKGTDQEHLSPVSKEDLSSDLIVFDVVYNPIMTPLLTYAKDVGASTISGIEMLIYQGAESFRLWTGQEPPVDIMRKAAIKAMEEKSRDV
ncbi:shikimate 5-dehydrogenase [Thermobaculum terrenum ATCC BAA-798]|uniref:Shikimate dehydrogenase (NADP(+)) n=1 Tax=Thermobaculum terrenum (strain ATCC BAA-798 / CCMEE 7001 / YNP1) TaxID=525904 RepID=D1CDM4_THET1|nr:shikimate dehydrogenase [Thermobaculum terrenum]ACZ41030.1 shikimate 5-dehydrogenase [Thermobaculum terrenum ATCC BAA-798]